MSANFGKKRLFSRIRFRRTISVGKNFQHEQSLGQSVGHQTNSRRELVANGNHRQSKSKRKIFASNEIKTIFSSRLWNEERTSFNWKRPAVLRFKVSKELKVRPLRNENLKSSIFSSLQESTFRVVVFCLSKRHPICFWSCRICSHFSVAIWWWTQNVLSQRFLWSNSAQVSTKSTNETIFFLPAKTLSDLFSLLPG